MATQQNMVEMVDLTDAFETADTFRAFPIEDLLRQVTDVFPDICPVHLSKLADENLHFPESIIEAILSDLEKGVSYPKRTVLGKRKRQSDPILEILAKTDDEFGESDVLRLNEYFMGPSWKEQISKIKSYRTKCVDYLKSRVFRSASKAGIKRIFDQHRDASLFQLYWLMGEAGYGEETAGWENAHRDLRPVQFENVTHDGDPVSLCKELYAARRIAAFKGRAVLNGRAEAANREKAEADGALRDCGCCFSDEPINRMVSCDANLDHLFCYACARKHAETQIGLSKYELNCLSMDDCPGNFRAVERKSYLDGKTMSALDRLEQDAALREANIENLASCPFCPYAAECPPAEVDKEFRCQNPDCRVVSCRFCNRETHIPKTCAEAAADNKDSARHQIEEAMSAAMIRKCNKCGTPFVKQSGCNKMTCTKPGCRNRQCYICGKSCDYDHFSRSGCPLHDGVGNDVESRHRNEAHKAQEAARKRLLEENPDMTEEELRVKLPDDLNTAKKKPAKPQSPGRRNGAPANRVPPPPLLQDLAQFRVAVFYEPDRPATGQQNQGHVFDGPYKRHGYWPPQGEPLHRALDLAPPDATDDRRTLPQAIEQQRPVFPAGQRDPIQASDRPQPPASHAVRTAAPAAAAPRPLGLAFDLTGDRKASTTPGATAPGTEARRHKDGANSASSSRTVSPSPLAQATEHMRQTESRYSLEVRLALERALHPYTEEIVKQVGNHIQAAWVGPMPPHLVASTRDLIRREVRNGVPRLVERELEEIDQLVMNVRWETLYRAQGLDQLQHHGEIAAPESAGEYFSLHAIVRSLDRRAPRHHEELAGQAHARVMKIMGKQQPPPRVAPLHHYGHPDRRPPQGQPGTARRIQSYLEMKRGRSQGRATAGTGADATNKTPGGKPGQPPAPPGLDLANTGIQSVPKPGTRFLSLLDDAGNGQGFTARPSQRPGRSGARPGTPASSTGTGSKDTPILIDDVDSEDERNINASIPTGDVLPYIGAGTRAMGSMDWGYGEPPKKREKV